MKNPLLVVAKGYAEWHKKANSVVHIVGGVHRVASEDELYLLGAGPGLNLDFQYGGRVLEIERGAVDHRHMVAWLNNQVKQKDSPKIKEEDVRDPDRFSAVLGNTLRGSIESVAVRDRLVIVKGRNAVLRAVKRMMGKEAANAITGYFGIRKVVHGV